jgi:hypothetical protein
MATSRAEQIEQLVAEYNQAEAQQEERLRRLYRLVKTGRGYRAVIFPGFNWTNCWDLPERLILPRLVDQRSRMITSVIPGEEGG